MTGPLIDYQAVLADLETRRGQIEAAIAGIKALLSGPPPDDGGLDLDAPPSTATVPIAPKSRSAPGTVVIQNDTFFGMSTAAAIRKFLAMTKRPQNPRAIADALHQGGQVHAVNEKTSYTNTYTALMRMKNKPDGVMQIKSGEWGLSEWYTNKPKEAE